MYKKRSSRLRAILFITEQKKSISSVANRSFKKDKITQPC